MDRDLVKRLPPGINTLPVGRGLFVERRSELPLKERERALLEKMEMRKMTRKLSSMTIANVRMRRFLWNDFTMADLLLN